MKLPLIIRAGLTLIAIAASFASVRAEKLPVASLTSVLADLARNVGGDHVDVFNLIPPGTDAHAFQLSVSDIREITRAKVVLASGLGFESFLGDLQSSVGPGPTFVIVGDAITPIYSAEGDHHDDHDHHHESSETHSDEGIPDPHWWHSIPNVRIATNLIRDAFIQADPANEDAYRTNAAAYQTRLTSLAAEIRLTVAALPRDRRVLVTSHDALGYFARDYEFEIHPVAGISSTDQPSSQRIRDLIAQIRAENVKAIFSENIENPKILSEITRETGAKLGGTLYADGLGTDEADTYESMMRHNATTIVQGLR